MKKEKKKKKKKVSWPTAIRFIDESSEIKVLDVPKEKLIFEDLHDLITITTGILPWHILVTFASD